MEACRSHCNGRKPGTFTCLQEVSAPSVPGPEKEGNPGCCCTAYEAEKNRNTLIDMLTFNHKSTAPCVRYFYLPSNPSKQSEVIEVLNSGSDVVQVPMREEDLELTAFFERGLTPREKALYKSSETWKVFSYWEELKYDHMQYGLKDEEMRVLLSLRYHYSLEDNAAVSA